MPMGPGVLFLPCPTGVLDGKNSGVLDEKEP
jgi:hypothetical protein